MSDSEAASDTGTAQKAGENDYEAKGKYLLLMVPDFAIDPIPAAIKPPEEPEEEPGPNGPAIPDNDSAWMKIVAEPPHPPEAGGGEDQQFADSAGRPMTSFLRLGVFHEDWENQPGGDLAKYAMQVTASQGGHLNADYGGEISTEIPDGEGIDETNLFLDDIRQRKGAGGTIPEERRKLESAHLFTRGGWWDHSDGNRITTTYGDKVEVIRGNYKMVVMQRQDDPAFGGGWDVSGGHVQDLGSNSMPGASVRVEFRPGMFGQPGTWHLENTTNNFIQTSDYAGDFFEHWYGNKKYSTVGSEEPCEFNTKLGKPFGNPHIHEKTWAAKIESETGSAKWRIPWITDTTYAVRTTEKVDVSTSIDSSTKAASMSEDVKVSGAIDSHTLAGSITETTTAGYMGSVTTAAVITEATIVAGAKADFTAALSTTSIAVSGNQNDVVATGLMSSVEAVYKRFDLTLGPHTQLNPTERDKTTIEELEQSINRLSTRVSDMTTAVNFRVQALSIAFVSVNIRIGIG
ncbi:MAG TPA: hypothetical protein PK156_26990 [Polyangium sp.]|nr:hypothetical protein [Polyangium sp.]